MIKNQSEGLISIFLKADTKLKCKNLIIHSIPQIPMVWLALVYSFETVISTEHVKIKQDLQVTQ